MPELDEQELAAIDQARQVLSGWLGAHFIDPDGSLAPEALATWRSGRIDEWLVFEPPGYVNKLFLVSGEMVYPYSPSQLSAQEAVAAARASAAGPER